MIEEVKQIFDDIRDAIIEMGGSVGECTSPEEYAEAIKNLQGNNAVLYIPVFQSAAAKPAKPTKQMSSNDPTDYPDGWGTTDGLVDNIWMTYTIVGPTSVYSDWTEPIKVNFEGIEDEKPVTRSFVICLELEPDPTMIPSTPTGGTWIYDGIQNYLQGPITSTFLDGTTTSDWSDNNEHREGAFTWMSTGTFLSADGSQIGNWSVPICINSARDGRDGQAGRNGVDGESQEFIYKLYHSKQELEQDPTPQSEPNIDDYVPGPHAGEIGYWCDHPNGIDHDVWPVEGMCVRQWNKDTHEWGNFIGPKLWSAWGEDGMDGDGVEYIFRVATNAEVVEDNNGVYHLIDIGNTWPPTCADDCANAYYTVAEPSGLTREELYNIYQQDEWVPGDNVIPAQWDRNWTDDPRDVDVNEPFEFVSIRKYKLNTETGEHEWGWFSPPVLWNKYYVTDAPIFTSFVFCRSTKDISGLQLEGGTVVNPFPDDETVDGELIHWYDTIPGAAQYPTEPVRANAPIWMTSSKFGSVDPQEVIVANWSSPKLMADNKYFNVEYSNSEEIIDPNTGEFKRLPKFDDTIAGVYPGRTQPFIDPADPEGVDEATWRTYCHDNNFGDWSDNAQYPKYMATCSFNDGAWSDWAVTQIRGENSIMVDFTNDRDELLYHEDGTKVIKRDGTTRDATTYAKLYNGVEEVVNPTWAIDVNTTTGVTVANGGAPYTTLPSPLNANTAYLRTDGYVVVTGINANDTQANVVVKTLIDGVAYSKTFVVVKNVGGNNYYLDFSPGAIVYNTTSGNATDKIPINVEVKCECQPDGEIKQLPLPTGYSVWIWDDGALGTSWTDLTHTCNWPVESGKGVKDTTGTIHIKLSKERNSPIADTLDGPEDIPVSFVEDGGDTEYRYQWNQSATDHPNYNASGGANPGTGWNTTVGNRPAVGWYLWCICALRNANGTYGTWGNAVRLTGDTGTPGEDGDTIEWIYKLDSSAGYNGTTGEVHPGNHAANGSSTEQQQADWVPNTWWDNPQGISKDHPTEYASWRTVTCSVNAQNVKVYSYGLFQPPIEWSHYGRNGMDGDGVEYVFIRTTTDVAPTISCANADSNGHTYTDDEYLPMASGQNIYQDPNHTKPSGFANECWDDPLGVSETGPWYEWYAKRSMNDPDPNTGVRVWKAYSSPMLIWNNWANDGEDSKSQEWIYKLDNGTGHNGTTGTIGGDPSKPISGNARFTNDDFVPTGWSDHPNGISSDHPDEYACYRKFDVSTQLWSEFSTPKKWSHWGEQGTDGDGVQYVYKLFDHELSDAERTSNIPTKPASQTGGEWIPTGWNDDPLAPTISLQFCYCSIIKRINGTWGNFEKLGLWSKYSEDAVSYTLTPSVNSVTKNPNTNTYSPASVSCTVTKREGATVVTADGTLKYTFNGGAETTYSSAVSTSGLTTNITFMYYVSSTKVAQITVPLITDGQKGATGAQGPQGNAGAKMRMRDWNTSYDWYQGASGEEWYDIAVYPASNDPSLQNISSNLDRLYRCKQTIMHGSIPSGGTPETLTAYFEKATGFSFVATDLMLARRINASEIEAGAITAGSLLTTNNDGQVLLENGDITIFDKNNNKKVWLHPGNLQISTETPVETTLLASAVTFSSAPYDVSTNSANWDWFTFSVTDSTVQPTKKLHIGSQLPNDFGADFSFVPNQNFTLPSNETININLYGWLYRRESSSDPWATYGQSWTTPGGMGIDYVIPQGTSFTANVAYTIPEQKITMYTNSNLNLSNTGQYKIVIYLYVTYSPTLNSIMSTRAAQLYEHSTGSGYTFSPIKSFFAQSTSVLCTEIGDDGIQTVLDPFNYFKVHKISSNNELNLEFMCYNQSNYWGGIKVDHNGIWYWKQNANPASWALLKGSTD